MGERGPPPKSVAERKLSGTDRKDRRPPADAAPTYDQIGKFPPPPKTLREDGIALWNELGPQLSRAGILRRPDLFAFELLCDLWQRFAEAARARSPVKPAAGGVTVATDGTAAIDPAPFTTADAGMLRSLFVEFCCTPAARKRIGAHLLKTPGAASGPSGGEASKKGLTPAQKAGRFGRFRR